MSFGDFCAALVLLLMVVVTIGLIRSGHKQKTHDRRVKQAIQAALNPLQKDVEGRIGRVDKVFRRDSP